MGKRKPKRDEYDHIFARHSPLFPSEKETLFSLPAIAILREYL